ncbi:MAG: hypothetical protein MJE77_04985 [Proteobacteria bacterium]|nr:hypothetical protein [Pseudomonadota bacterium]
MRFMLLALALGTIGFGCDNSLKGEGEECFSASQCSEGLLCDFGASPSVCRQSQSGTPGTPNPGDPPADASVPRPDAAVVDASPTPIDAPAALDASLTDAAAAAQTRPVP